MRKYRVTILDDDVKSIKLLSNYLREFCPKVKIVGYAHGYYEALSVIRNKKPDIFFININSENNLGLEFAKIAQSTFSKIIFTSNTDSLAMQAIKFNPIDYLLKPYNIADISKAIDNAIAESERFIDVEKEEDKLIALSTGQEFKVVNVDQIVFCESSGNYTLFHINNLNDKVLATKNIGIYEDMLNNKTFFRIHRKYLVNLNFIASIYKKDGFYCRLKNNSILSISRRNREKLQNRLSLG